LVVGQARRLIADGLQGGSGFHPGGPCHGEKMAFATNKAALTADKPITRIYERGEPGSFDVMEWLNTFRQAPRQRNRPRL